MEEIHTNDSHEMNNRNMYLAFSRYHTGVSTFYNDRFLFIDTDKKIKVVYLYLNLCFHLTLFCLNAILTLSFI